MKHQVAADNVIALVARGTELITVTEAAVLAHQVSNYKKLHQQLMSGK